MPEIIVVSGCSSVISAGDFNKLPDKPAAVKKAAELMKVKEITVWEWMKGARQVSPSMLLLMEFIASIYAPAERPGISD